MQAAGPWERKWMLLEFFFALVPATVAGLMGGLMALALVPMALFTAGMAAFLAITQGELPSGESLAFLSPILLATLGLVGLASLWVLFLARFQGREDFAEMNVVAHGIWAGILAIVGLRLLVGPPAAAPPDPSSVFFLLVTLRLWWLAQLGAARSPE